MSPSSEIKSKSGINFATAWLLAHIIYGLAPNASAASDVGAAHLMDILVGSYPDFLRGHTATEILWKDGTRWSFDDGKGNKTFAERLEAPSLKDMFYDRYVSGHLTSLPSLNSDPGRARQDAFFTRMYGDCRKGDVKGNLVSLVWLPRKWGKKIEVTRINGMAAKLKEVSAELDALPAEFDKYLFPLGGTYNCRTIAGTTRRSAHATASAIDLNPKYSSYWLWSPARKQLNDPNEVPQEIVDIFERHGFIWGGKWFHFDTMHFEYRPEIIAAGKQSP